MSVLITGALHPLSRTLTDALRDEYSLRLTSTHLPPAELEGLEYVRADLRNEADAATAVRGISAIIHLEPYALSEAPELPDTEILDRASRGTFMLLRHALAAGTRQVVLLSRLNLLDAHPPEAVIDETWQPLPDTHAAALAPYLGELTTREFVRAEPLGACCFRVGALDREPDGTTTDAVLQAVRAALTADWDQHPYHWSLYHVGGGPRFSNAALEQPPLSLRLR